MTPFPTVEDDRRDPRVRGTQLHGRIVPVGRLEAPSIERMFTLLTMHFDGVDRPTFESDLDEKTSAILLEEDTGILRGFSTLHVYPTGVRTGTTIVYSGDTIVERGWWGSAALPRTWIRAVRSLASAETDDVYWFLLTSGFRTYRFLPVFFRCFLPRASAAPREDDASLLHAVASERFGGRYDPSSGIVRLARPQRLRDDLLAVPEGRVLDPDIAFFLSRNAGHCLGDELACLARLHDDNLTAAGRRMVRGAEGR